MHFDDSPNWELCLYVAEDRPRSAEAILTVKAMCDKALQERYHLEIVNIMEGQERSADEPLPTLPCLIRRSPLPVVRIIGDIADNFEALLDYEQVPR
jgi:circadian clock protein KaiB